MGVLATGELLGIQSTFAEEEKMAGIWMGTGHWEGDNSPNEGIRWILVPTGVVTSVSVDERDLRWCHTNMDILDSEALFMPPPYVHGLISIRIRWKSGPLSPSCKSFHTPTRYENSKTHLGVCIRRKFFGCCSKDRTKGCMRTTSHAVRSLPSKL